MTGPPSLPPDELAQQNIDMYRILHPDSTKSDDEIIDDLVATVHAKRSDTGDLPDGAEAGLEELANALLDRRSRPQAGP